MRCVLELIRDLLWNADAFFSCFLTGVFAASRQAFELTMQISIAVAIFDLFISLLFSMGAGNTCKLFNLMNFLATKYAAKTGGVNWLETRTILVATLFSVKHIVHE